MLHLEKTKIQDVFILTPKRFGDARGWFSENWNKERMAKAGLDFEWVQDNHSFSADCGTVRGLHFQAPPRAQDKLVRCTRGAIVDVAVDVRKGSSTFGEWILEELSADNGRQLFIPKGFLHGFATIEKNTEVQYKVTDYYDAASDGSVRWDSLPIDWRLQCDPILSDKDISAPAFGDWESPFSYGNIL